MGIEMRNGRPYYYRKVWREGRCVSEYVGTGDLGVVFRQADLREAELRAAERHARRERLRQARAADREALDLARRCQQLATLAMLAAGHYRHRGQWRRRRYDPMTRPPAHLQMIEGLRQQAKDELAIRRERAKADRGRAELPPAPAPGDDSPEARRAILKRADRHDATPEDIAAMRALLDRREAFVSMGNLMRQALDRALGELHATPLARELTARDVEARRRALGYGEASALEQPLIDHLLLAELRLGIAEQEFSAIAVPGQTHDQVRHYEARLNAAQRRYLQAVETFARVRRVRVELARVTSPDGTRAEALALEGPGA